MSSEFQVTGPGRVTSARGFSAAWHAPGYVEYADTRGTVRVETEVCLRPPRIVVYPRSGQLRGMPEGEADEIVANVIRVLEFFGNQVERWQQVNGW